MTWAGDVLRENPELALLLSIAVGFPVGRVHLGRGFQRGPMLGTLIAGLAIGRVGVEVPPAMQREFFLIFLFALGSARARSSSRVSVRMPCRRLG